MEIIMKTNTTGEDTSTNLHLLLHRYAQFNLLQDKGMDHNARSQYKGLQHIGFKIIFFDIFLILKTVSLYNEPNTPIYRFLRGERERGGNENPEFCSSATFKVL